MKNMNCVSTMPEIMPEITDEAIIEALFAQRPYEEKVINSAFLEIPAEYQRKLNIPNVEKMSAEFTTQPPVSMIENSRPAQSTKPYWRSRVVPAVGSTIAARLWVRR